jgi:hypothetical protein
MLYRLDFTQLGLQLQSAAWFTARTWCICLAYWIAMVSRPLVPDALAVSFIGGKDRRKCLLPYLCEPDLSDGTGKWDY